MALYLFVGYLTVLSIAHVVHDSVMLPSETCEMRKHLSTLSLAKLRQTPRQV
jgi:hypothetical protein